MITTFKVFDNLPEGVQALNFEWKYVYLNDIAVNQSKLKREDLLNHSIVELYPGVEKTEMFEALSFVMKERVSKNMINKFEYADKSVSYFNLYIEPIEIGIIIFSFDVTPQKLQVILK